jgi:hypothetical protein
MNNFKTFFIHPHPQFEDANTAVSVPVSKISQKEKQRLIDLIIQGKAIRDRELSRGVAVGI